MGLSTTLGLFLMWEIPPASFLFLFVQTDWFFPVSSEESILGKEKTSMEE